MHCFRECIDVHPVQRRVETFDDHDFPVESTAPITSALGDMPDWSMNEDGDWAAPKRLWHASVLRGNAAIIDKAVRTFARTRSCLATLSSGTPSGIGVSISSNTLALPVDYSALKPRGLSNSGCASSHWQLCAPISVAKDVIVHARERTYLCGGATSRSAPEAVAIVQAPTTAAWGSD